MPEVSRQVRRAIQGHDVTSRRHESRDAVQ